MQYPLERQHSPWSQALADRRLRLYDDMYFLIDKYAPFADGEGPSRIKEADRATLSTERDHTKT